MPYEYMPNDNGGMIDVRDTMEPDSGEIDIGRTMEPTSPTEPLPQPQPAPIPPTKSKIKWVWVVGGVGLLLIVVFLVFKRMSAKGTSPGRLLPTPARSLY